MSVNLDPLFLDRLRATVQTVLPDAVSLRHDLHSHPELSGEEERTASVVSQMLSQAGIAHQTGVGGTHGIVAIIESGAGTDGPTFALRGDMDALPILEENEVDYKSLNPGIMHACGHDGHTANLLGAALVLNQLRDALPPGRVKLLFQPAEETVRGADALVAAGAIDDVDAIVMLHGWPHLPVGQIGVRNGPAMASSDTYKLLIKGKGGHGAYPHDTFDPIMCGAQIVTALQTLVSREISPVAPAVVSVTMFHAGTARNIIPTNAEICGTVRTLDPELRKTMAERIERVIAGVSAALRCDYEIEYTYGTPVTVNDALISDLIRAVGSDLLGAEGVTELTEPTMGAEDFAYYVEKIPGAMFRLGTNCPYLLHTPKYDFGDAPLETGILLMVEATRRFLAQGGLPGK
ncbi:MAG: M20 family metallopeptidase [Armatimonadota bacterium]